MGITRPVNYFIHGVKVTGESLFIDPHVEGHHHI